MRVARLRAGAALFAAVLIWAPRAGAGHGGIGVHHGEEAVHRRDLLALEPPGIARAVGAFVVAQDGVRRHCEIGTGEGDAVSDFRMAAQIAPRFFRKGFWRAPALFSESHVPQIVISGEESAPGALGAGERSRGEQGSHHVLFPGGVRGLAGKELQKRLQKPVPSPGALDVLLLVHEVVGFRQQGGQPRGLSSTGGAPHGDAQRDVLRKLVEAFHGVKDPAPGFLGEPFAALGQQGGEFVPSHPGHHVRRPEGASEQSSRFPEQAISCAVSQEVVHELEAVEVRHHHAQRVEAS